jgi:hypothetical protein
LLDTLCKAMWKTFWRERAVPKVSKKPIVEGLLVVTVLFVIGTLAYSATPNPGHAWTDIGDGVIQFNTPTALHTYTLPDGNATIFTNFLISQGDLVYGSAASTTSLLPKNTTATRYLANTGSNNNPQWDQVSLSNGVVNILPGANGGTGNASTTFTGQTLARTYTLPDANATILTSNAAVTPAQGGTGANITASNGGILYSGSSVFSLLSGTATAGLILRSGASGAPSWSSSTYPNTVGPIGQYLVSDGTNWVASSTVVATTTTVQTRSYNATGATTGKSVASLTSFNIGMFRVPAQITVNQISFTVTAVTTAGTMKVCVYNEAGTKLIDVTTATIAAGTVTTSTSTPVTLPPGNYYIANGCATTCSDTTSYFTSTAVASMNGASIPAGKKVYEGTGTMTSGTCNATLPTITGASAATLDARLDN